MTVVINTPALTVIAVVRAVGFMVLLSRLVLLIRCIDDVGRYLDRIEGYLNGLHEKVDELPEAVRDELAGDPELDWILADLRRPR